MAFGRLERRRTAPPMSDINMTPLIDVMLVLLVIFMLAAPLIGSSLKLDLPHAASATPDTPAEALELTVDAQGRIRLGPDALDLAAVGARLHTAARERPDTAVHLRADRAVPYGQVAEIIGLAQAAGLHRIAFAAEATGVAPAASR